MASKSWNPHIAGLLLGGALYAWAYPFFKNAMIPIGNLGKIFLLQVLGINHRIVIVVFAAAVVFFFLVFEKKSI